ncbi:MAG TPA: phage head closure protein [Candidatus Moranbacteria bacterium]|nr:phage head closure protein [Candidatus Moranbacteria bacterium]
MRAGELRHRVEIGRYLDIRDEHGDPKPGRKRWQPVAFVWAAVEGLHGSYYFQAQQTVSQADHKITIRYRRGVRAGMIVRHDGREFTIQSALDEEGRRRLLALTCREVEASGS